MLGRAPQYPCDAHAQALAAQQYALTLLHPGTPCSEIYARHNEWLRARGLPAELRLSIHGMGYDMVERPLLRHDETMRLEAGMAIIVHPGVADARVFAHNTDIYFIGSQGPGECVHRTPKEIFEIQ